MPAGPLTVSGLHQLLFRLFQHQKRRNDKILECTSNLLFMEYVLLVIFICAPLYHHDFNVSAASFTILGFTTASIACRAPPDIRISMQNLGYLRGSWHNESTSQHNRDRLAGRRHWRKRASISPPLGSDQMRRFTSKKHGTQVAGHWFAPLHCRLCRLSKGLHCVVCRSVSCMIR